MFYQVAVDYTKKEINDFTGGEKAFQKKVMTEMSKEFLSRGILLENLTSYCVGTNRKGVTRYIGEVAVMKKDDYIEMEKKAMEYDALVARVKALGAI